MNSHQRRKALRRFTRDAFSGAFDGYYMKGMRIWMRHGGCDQLMTFPLASEQRQLSAKERIEEAVGASAADFYYTDLNNNKINLSSGQS